MERFQTEILQNIMEQREDDPQPVSDQTAESAFKFLFRQTDKLTLFIFQGVEASWSAIPLTRD